MGTIMYTDAEGTALLDLLTISLPDEDSFLLMCHLRLWLDLEGQRLLDILGARGRSCFIADTLLRSTYDDDSHDTCVLIGIATPSHPVKSNTLADLHRDTLVHVWPLDRPLPDADTLAVFIPIDALDN